MNSSLLDFWAGMDRSARAMLATGIKVAETIQASGPVIESRSRTMLAASCDPLAGDYAELGRMVPEKVAAFSKAGASIMGDAQAIQAQFVANWQTMLRIGAGSRFATAGELQSMTIGSAAMIERTAKAAGRALAPVHRTAMGNARRLTRNKKR